MALLAVTAAFLYGLAHLFALRFERGDIYPEYSSLRADPPGAKALYESLDQFLSVRRNYQPLTRLDEGRHTELLGRKLR